MSSCISVLTGALVFLANAVFIAMLMLALNFRFCFFFFSSRRRHTRLVSDWSSDVCSSDLGLFVLPPTSAHGRVVARRPDEQRRTAGRPTSCSPICRSPVSRVRPWSAKARDGDGVTSRVHLRRHLDLAASWRPSALFHGIITVQPRVEVVGCCAGLFDIGPFSGLCPAALDLPTQ